MLVVSNTWRHVEKPLTLSLAVSFHRKLVTPAIGVLTKIKNGPAEVWQEPPQAR